MEFPGTTLTERGIQGVERKTMKLNQVIAVVAGKKSRTQALLTEAHRGWNREAISGIAKRYTSKDEDGECLPSENKNIQVDVRKRIADVSAALTDFYDLVATQETSNIHAKADVLVEGSAIVKDAPVTVLLFLEKQLEDLRTFVANLPTLPPDREWKWDENRNCYVTAAVETVRTNKVPEVLVKYPATEQHPAQTEVYTKDVPVGSWSTVHLSSAIPAQRQEQMLARVVVLQDAVKLAREAANGIDAFPAKIGESVLNYVFGD